MGGCHEVMGEECCQAGEVERCLVGEVGVRARRSRRDALWKPHGSAAVVSRRTRRRDVVRAGNEVARREASRHTAEAVG